MFSSIVCAKSIVRAHSGHLNECGPTLGGCQDANVTFESDDMLRLARRSPSPLLHISPSYRGWKAELT